MTAEVGETLAETEHEYPHGQFRMLALETIRLSGFELLAHDGSAWVGRDEIGDFNLAPADVALVTQLIAHGYWF